MRTPSRGALVGLVASALLGGRVALVFLLVSTSLLLVALMILRKGCRTLVDDEWVGGVIGRETHPDRGEALSEV